MNAIEQAREHFIKRNKGLKKNPVCQEVQKRVDKQNYEIARNELAIIALERQIYRKPLINGEMTFCPYCKHLVENGWEKFSHCPDCGQAIDRSE